MLQLPEDMLADKPAGTQDRIETAGFPGGLYLVIGKIGLWEKNL